MRCELQIHDRRARMSPGGRNQIVYHHASCFSLVQACYHSCVFTNNHYLRLKPSQHSSANSRPASTDAIMTRSPTTVVAARYADYLSNLAPSSRAAQAAATSTNKRKAEDDGESSDSDAAQASESHTFAPSDERESARYILRSSRRAKFSLRARGAEVEHTVAWVAVTSITESSVYVGGGCTGVFTV